MPKKRKKGGGGIRDWINASLIAVFVFWFLRVFVFDIFMVSSTSMNPSLHPGDVIIVNKTAYGARFPITLLSVPLSGKNLPFFRNVKAYSSLISLPYFRLPSFSKPKYGDIVVFNKPSPYEAVDKGTLMAKRIAALPGDTIAIYNALVYNNGSKQNGAFDCFQAYEVKTSFVPDREFFAELGIFEGGPVRSLYRYHFHMTANHAEHLKSIDGVVSVRPIILPADTRDIYIFQPSEAVWNADNWGPVYLPRKADTIFESSEFFESCRLLMLTFEPKNKVFENASGQFIVFRNSYYFLLGDNRSNSVDSRHWGPLPEKYLLGRGKSRA